MIKNGLWGCKTSESRLILVLRGEKMSLAWSLRLGNETFAEFEKQAPVSLCNIQ
jgi:hypothetical protein